MSEESKPKFKCDWELPLLAAVCLFQAIGLYFVKKEGIAELVISLLLGFVLCYLAVFIVVNAILRKIHEQGK